MKIKVSIQVEISDGSADEFVINNLKSVGFAEAEGPADGLCLTYEGDISVNDLAYSASMMRSHKRSS
jgi:hypothetical protein